MRNSKYEVLRITSMMMIVVCHLSLIPLLTMDLNQVNNNILLVSESIGLFGRFGNNLFVMITGYFLVDKSFSICRNIKRVQKISVQVSSWSIIFAVISIFTIGIQPTFLIKSLFPIVLSLYWFVTPFVVLIILSPFINIVLNNLDKKQNIYLGMICIFITSVVPTLTFRSNEKVGFHDIGIFISLYIISALIKKYHIGGKVSIKYLFVVIGFSMLVQMLNIFLIFRTHSGDWTLSQLSKATYLNSQQSIFLLVASVATFLIVTRMKDFSSKKINTISSATFGIYLIHQNPFVSQFLFNSTLIKNMFRMSVYQYIVLFFIFSFLIFVSCALLELIRKLIFNRLGLDGLFMRFFNHIFSSLYFFVNKK